MSQYQSEGSHPQLYARNSPLTSTFEDHSTEYPSAHPEDYSEPPRITGSPAPSSNAFLLPRLDNRDLSERTLFHLATDGTVSAQAETSDPYADHSQQSPAVAGVVQCIHRECNMPYLLYINSTTQSGRQQAYGESSPAEWCTHVSALARLAPMRSGRERESRLIDSNLPSTLGMVFLLSTQMLKY